MLRRSTISSRVHLCSSSSLPRAFVYSPALASNTSSRPRFTRIISSAARAFSQSTATTCHRPSSWHTDGTLSALPSLSHSAKPPINMSALTARRPHSTQSKGKEPEQPDHSHDHAHDHDHASHSHSHSHSHGLFSTLVHTHDHAEEGHTKDPEKIVQALQGQGEYRVSPFNL
ncbi:hypothetical protein C8Q70DRAFT_693385 [Cubamyces menziesii]|nr:hypothetical protein C8Q70DRAFT_693385 [Cubamyces menziesii]